MDCRYLLESYSQMLGIQNDNLWTNFSRKTDNFHLVYVKFSIKMQKHLSLTKVTIANCQRYAKVRENRCLEGCQEKERKQKEWDSALFTETVRGSTNSSTFPAEGGGNAKRRITPDCRCTSQAGEGIAGTIWKVGRSDQNHRIVEAGKDLWRSSCPTQAGLSRASFSGACPDNFFIFPRRENLGSLCQWSVTLTVKRYFLMFR